MNHSWEISNIPNAWFPSDAVIFWLADLKVRKAMEQKIKSSIFTHFYSVNWSDASANRAGSQDQDISNEYNTTYCNN